MLVATLSLVSTTPYSQSSQIPDDLLGPGEKKDDTYESRFWRFRAHRDMSGMTYIPGTQIANAIKAAGKRMRKTIPGKKNSEYGKCFESGIMVVDHIPLGVHVDQMKSERLFVPADATKGGGKRVWRTFPLFPEWSGVVNVHIFDEDLEKPDGRDAFTKAVKNAGLTVGLGRFRPANGGFYGRFNVNEIGWAESD
jgi:hypothetical protein